MDEVISISIVIIVFVLVFAVFSVVLDGRFFVMKKAAKAVILAICIFMILYETILFRRPKNTMTYELALFWSYRLAFAGKKYYAVEIIDNILLYIPFGFMLPAVFKNQKVWKMVLVILLMTAAIESIQLVTRIGLFEFDDIMDNTMGGVIGLGMYALVGKLKYAVRKRRSN